MLGKRRFTLVEVCPSEVKVKPPEVSTTRVSPTMVKPTVVKVVRVVWFTYNRNCNDCHAMGHFAKCCQNKTVHYAEHDLYNDDMYYDTPYHNNLFAKVTDCNEAMETLTGYATEKCDVKQVNSVKNDVMTVEFQTTCDDFVKFKIDTAADCSVLSKASYDKMVNKPTLRPSKVAFRGISGNPSKACGTVTLPVKHKSEVVFLNCEVVDDVNCPNLLSESESLRLNLVKPLVYPHLPRQYTSSLQM